jgi:hypothetical protein
MMMDGIHDPRFRRDQRELAAATHPARSCMLGRDIDRDLQAQRQPLQDAERHDGIPLVGVPFIFLGGRGPRP